MSLVSIQNIEITLTGNTQTSNTGTINSVNPSNAIVLLRGWNVNTTNTEGRRSVPAVELTNSTTVTVTRQLVFPSADDITYAITVIEDDEFTVQRGTSTTSKDPINITITEVADLNKTMAIVYTEGDPGSPHLDCFAPQANLTTTTNLLIDFNAEIFNCTHAWQVVECDRWSVQKITGSTSNTGTSTSVSIAAVGDIANTMVFGTIFNNSTTAGMPQDHTWQWELTNTTTISLARNVGETATHEYCWYVVEDPNFSVQRGYFTVGNATSNTTTINSVVTDNSFINRTCAGNIRQWSDDTTERTRPGKVTILELQDSTTLNGKRGLAVDENDRQYYEIIEFVEVGRVPRHGFSIFQTPAIV